MAAAFDNRNTKPIHKRLTRRSRAATRVFFCSEELKAHEDELTVIDITCATSTTRSYEDYAQAYKSTPTNELRYYGLLLYGKRKLVNRFTGSLGLLR